MIKKIAFLLVAVALIAAACDSDSDDTTTTTAAAEETTTTAAAEETTTTAAAEETTTTAAAPAGEAGTIIIGTTDTVSSLDSSDAYATRDWEVMKNFSEPLIKWEPGGADTLLPGLAEALPVISDDGLTYTLTLREGLKFGDGADLTNAIVASQLNRLLTISETGPNQVGLTLGNPYVESIEASGDRDVVFTLTQPLAFFSQVLAGAPYIPMHPDFFPEDELVIFPEAPIYGAGPFTVTEFVPGETMTFERNEFYYGDPPNVDRIIVRHFADPQSMALAVQNGEIDIAWRILGSELALPLGDVEGLNVAEIDAPATRYLVVNHVLEPTNDPNVQKAIASVIDRDEISDRIFGGAVTPLYSQVPPAFFGANEAFDEIYGSPDIEAAQAFLEASGYSEDNKLQLPFWYPPEHYGATGADAMLILVEQLEATGMIEVDLQAQEWSTYVGAATGGQEYPLFLLGWFLDFPDAENYTQPWIENGGQGSVVTSYEDGSITPGVNPELLVALDAQRGLTDPAEREAALDELQNIYAEEVVTVPLWVEPEFIVYRDGISGDSNLPNPQALNIGASMEFIYSVLRDAG